MSIENVVRFLERLDSDAGFNQRVLDGAATSAAWVTAAEKEGLEFTAAELRSVTEKLVDRPVGEEEAVGQIIDLFREELGDEALHDVVGGISGDLTSSSTLKSRLSSLDYTANYVKESGPMWVKSAGSFDSGL